MYPTYETQYLNLISQVLAHGRKQDNRTGVPTIGLVGAMLRADLRRGEFPALTTRKIAFKSITGELIAFLRASKSAADFRALGCKFWDQNANENKDWLSNPFREGEDSLGPVYGAQWRDWPAYKVIPISSPEKIQRAHQNGFEVVHQFVDPTNAEPVCLMYKAIDQLADCLNLILNNPTSRRILFHGWNPAALDEMALPPCHLLYQFHPDVATRELSMTLFIRSNDLGLGQPANMCEAALLLSLVARLTGYHAGEVVVMISDAHIYENQIEMLSEQLTRQPYAPPRLMISPAVPHYKDGLSEISSLISEVSPSQFWLNEYTHHPALTAPMAV